MKKNSGFVLFETLVVSTLILGTLIFLFIQISTIKNSYYVSFKYNTIPGLYNANVMANFLTIDGYSTLKTNIDSSDYGYVDITDCVNSGSLCYKIVDDIDAKVVLLAQNDISTLKNNLEQVNIDKSFKKFIKRLPNTKDDGKYRLIIAYNNDTYATISVKEDKSDQTKYTLTNLISNSSFEDGNNSWSSSGSTNTFSITSDLSKSGNSSASLTTSSSGNNNLSQTVNLLAGHIYYVSEYIYLNSKLVGSAKFNLYLNASNDYGNISFESLKNKKWTMVSSLFTVNTSGNYTFNTLNINDTNIINVDNVLLIDLTSDFGAGVEPDQNWCDSYIKYFNTTTTIYK